MELSTHETATAVVTLDQLPFWGSALRQLGTILLTLPIGFFTALLAANALKRQIVEPLSDCALPPAGVPGMNALPHAIVL